MRGKARMLLLSTFALSGFLIAFSALARMSPSNFEQEIKEADDVKHSLATLKKCGGDKTRLQYLDQVSRHMKVCLASDGQFDQIDAIRAKGEPNDCSTSSAAEQRIMARIENYRMRTSLLVSFRTPCN